MKACKLVHIHGGNEVEVHNGNFLFVEEFPETDDIIQQYLAEGYEVKQIIPDVTPAIQEEGAFTFYKGGIVVYFEKEEAENK